jgi:polysaccharide biosynthesis transport protein
VLKEVIDLKDYLNTVKNKFWLIMLGVVIFTSASTFITYFILEPVYESEAKLIVHDAGDSESGVKVADIDTQLKMIPTYTDIMQSPAVLQQAAKKLNMKSNELKKQIKVQNKLDSQIISIIAESEHSAKSAEMANVVADISIQEIQKTMSMNNLLVLDYAKASSAPIRPIPIVNIGISFVFSLFAGIFLVCFYQFLVRPFTSYSEIQKTLKLPILGIIRKFGSEEYDYYTMQNGLPTKRRKHSLYRGLITRWGNNSIEKEAYRSFMATLLFSIKNKNIRSIALTSPEIKAGTSLTCGNLAVALAQSGNKTVYVDMNLSRPAGHEMFSTANTMGLFSYTKGKKKIEEIIQTTFHSKLDIITTGRVQETSVNIFTAEGFSTMITELKKKYDYVIIDSPAVMESADALMISNCTDGVVFVIDYKHGDMKNSLYSLDQLNKCEANVLGLFINRYRT